MDCYHAHHSGHTGFAQHLKCEGMIGGVFYLYLNKFDEDKNQNPADTVQGAYFLLSRNQLVQFNFWMHRSTQAMRNTQHHCAIKTKQG